MRKVGELRARIFLQTLQGDGRAVFLDYAPSQGGIGTPGDAQRAITVGAADPSGQRRPDSSRGPALGLELLNKPDVLAFTPAETGAAASFAAGLAASALSAGASQGHFLRDLHVPPGGVLRLPGDWQRR
jgi:hypothetical protein